MDLTEKATGRRSKRVKYAPTIIHCALASAHPYLLTYLLTRTLHIRSVSLDEDEDVKFRCHGRRRFK